MIKQSLSFIMALGLLNASSLAIANWDEPEDTMNIESNSKANFDEETTFSQAEEDIIDEDWMAYLRQQCSDYADAEGVATGERDTFINACIDEQY